MPNVQWTDIPFQLISTAVTIDLNPLIGVIAPSSPHPLGPQWIVLPDGSQAGSAKRVTRDNSPQKGGEIVHKHFKAGLVFQLKMIACDVKTVEGEMTAVCGSDLVTLFDQLLLCLNAMENVDGRLVWTPTGHASRLMDAARWLGSDGQAGGAFTSVVTDMENEVFTGATFALLSPFPYAIDYAQTTTEVGGSAGVVTIDNTGNTDFFPVLHVNGPTSAFQFYNHTTDMVLSYDATFPGASPIASGRSVEFDFFRETAYFGPVGGPWTGANAKPGIDIVLSDFWPITPGVSTNIELVGASGQLLWQPAYTG